MIFKSPFPDVAIPDKSVTAFVLEDASAHADKPALIDGPSGRALTYGQLADAAHRVGRGLAARGFGKGDVLAIYSPNLPEYAVAFHGAASVGGVNTTINPMYTVEELSRQLRDADAKLLVTVPEFLDKARAAAKETSVEEILVFGESEGATPFQELMVAEGEQLDVSIEPATDLVVLPYSSGTTGLQKGVMLSHQNIVANIRQAETVFGDGFSEDDVLIGILPFFHIYGMVVIMNLALHRGATVVTMPRFDLAEFLRLLQNFKVTAAFLVPPIVLALSKHPLVDEFDLSSIRFIFSGAAPLGPELATACGERLHCGVYQGYGLTETSPVSHATPLDPARAKTGSVGPCVPNTECKLVDGSGKELGPGEEGEIWIRGPQVMQGYLNQPEATANTIDAEGWLHSGDVGYADDDGYFYIVDRLKELIKYKGMQVAPAELEALLLTHPAISDAAVIPVPDDEAGEIPKAFVVAKEPISEEEVMAFVAEHVAPYKKVRRVELVSEVPKSPSGKILRRILVQREREKKRTGL